MKHGIRNARRLSLAGLLAAGLLAAAAPVAAEVTAFQQGVSPSPEYSGCVDTFLASHGWAHDRPSYRPKSVTLSRPALMRFDLAGLGEGRQVRRALLRLSFASIPSPELLVEARTLTRAWDATATWYEHAYKDAKKSDENNWTKPGGDLDAADFGQGKPGLVAKAVVRGGPFGHIVELDVTPLVAEWVSGKRPNHGFHLSTARRGFSIASAEWPLGAHRPALIVEHYAANEQADPGVKLALPEALGPKCKLSPLGGRVSADRRRGRLVRFGRNANCQYRDGHSCGYAKQDPRYGGNWGWTPRLRIGGTAGDLNHALFRFDLSALPEEPSISQARLRVCVDTSGMRLPADTMGQTPPEPDKRQKQRTLARFRSRLSGLSRYSFGLFRVTDPGEWTEAGFDFRRRAPGKPWVDGNLAATTEAAPVAVAHVGEQWRELLAAGKIADTWLEWDVTRIVQAWVTGKVPNRGLVLDGRLMGGAMRLLADDWIEPDRRPYLEVEVFPAPKAKPAGPLKPEPLLPPAGRWVEPMRKAHARWTGTKGTFGQYGDSITITMAFWTPLLYGERKGATGEMGEALATARKYIHRPCWRRWKGGGWGNTGNMTIDWAFRNVDAWQKKMNPEVAVILFGTNDVGSGPHPPIYTEKYAAVIDRMLADGTIPIVTTLPPHGRQVGSEAGLKVVLDLRQAAIAVARQKKVPLIDFYSEIVKRQPKEWRKIMVPDGLHPSYPKEHRTDWTDEGLRHSGYTLRNYLTLKAWYQVHQKVLKE